MTRKLTSLQMSLLLVLTVRTKRWRAMNPGALGALGHKFTRLSGAVMRVRDLKKLYERATGRGISHARIYAALDGLAEMNLVTLAETPGYEGRASLPVKLVKLSAAGLLLEDEIKEAMPE